MLPAGRHQRRRKHLVHGVHRDEVQTGPDGLVDLCLLYTSVLRYELADGTTILVRPSGTEPKIKVYVLTIGENPAARDENLRKYGE